MSRSIESVISRLGKEVDVLSRSETGTDAFNNPTSQWNKIGTTHAVRTYPNRNTQMNSGGGPYESDNPVFLFMDGETPPSDGRIVYDGVTYEMQAPTHYEDHSAMFGKLVTE